MRGNLRFLEKKVWIFLRFFLDFFWILRIMRGKVELNK